MAIEPRKELMVAGAIKRAHHEPRVTAARAPEWSRRADSGVKNDDGNEIKRTYVQGSSSQVESPPPPKINEQAFREDKQDIIQRRALRRKGFDKKTARRLCKAFTKNPVEATARELYDWIGTQLLAIEIPPRSEKLRAPKHVPRAGRQFPDLPPGAIKLTLELVNRCRTSRGGFTNATLKAFGLAKPLIAGWPERLVGTWISRDGYREAFSGADLYNSGPLETLPSPSPLSKGHK